MSFSTGSTWIQTMATAVFLLAAPALSRATDVAVVPLWDGETHDPTDLSLNRFGGPAAGGNHATVAHTNAVVRSGIGAFEIATSGSIPAAGFDFVLVALTGFGPTEEHIDTRDLSPFSEIRFWLDNETGAPFSLVFEIKDYLDSNDNKVRRRVPISPTSGWIELILPLDVASGWEVLGEPDLTRAKTFALVIEADQGAPVNGSLFVDDMVLIEQDGPLESESAAIEALVDRLARRQFRGIWGSRDRWTGLVPSISAFADQMGINVVAALVKLLPGAVDRGWLGKAEADAYVEQVVETLGALMESAAQVPPRFVDRVTLEPLGEPSEESSVDAAMLFLALYQYRSLPGIDSSLCDAIDTLLARFDLAAFGSPSGWRLAYQIDSKTFTKSTFDGYSGEPWLISLAAHLSTTHHLDIEALYHSSTKRVMASLEDPERAHLVHTLPEFRAPFVQWLMTLFVDVADRGADTFPDPKFAANPHANAVLYQQEVHARKTKLGRPAFLQPDAGDDGSGSFFAQFSCYEDFDAGTLFMPWSVAFSFLAEPPVAEAALRTLLAAGLHGPLGLTDSVDWATGAPAPSRITARHDFWNLALSTMAFVEYLYRENALLASLPEVTNALDRVFVPEPSGDLLLATALLSVLTLAATGVIR